MKFKEVFIVSSALLCLAGCGGSGGHSHRVLSGYKVLFIRGGDIWSADSDGTNQTQITDTAAIESNPVGSPDGKKILCSVNSGGPNRIEVMNTDGSHPTLLTADGNVEVSPQYSPDGSKIVFMSNRADSVNYDIWIMDSDGGNQTRLTTNSDSELDPHFLPDGRIVYSQLVPNVSATIMVMNADGSSPTGVNNGVTFSIEPELLPNGERVVFRAGETLTAQIATMNTDGSDIDYLTPNDELSFALCPTPDGKILFNANTPGTIDIIDADGNNRTNFLTDALDAGILPIYAQDR